MNMFLELPINRSMQKICFILAILLNSVQAVPAVVATTELPVDPNVDPCDDFYEFTCAKFKQNHPIPEDRSSIDQFSIIKDSIEEKIKKWLEKPIDASEMRPFRLAKSMYQACMNTTNIEANSLIVLDRILKTIGGWPVIEGDSWNSDSFEWQRTAYQFLRSGFDSGYDVFFQVYIGPDPRNSTEFIINLVQPMGLVPDELMKNGWDEPVVKAYYEYMKNVANKLGAGQLRVDEEMKEAINLEIAISKLKIPKEEQRNISSVTNFMTIRELNEQYPYVDWLDYINNVMYPDKKGHLDDTVNVVEPKYLRELKNVFEGQTQRNLANYMYWQAVSSVADFMDDDIRNWKLKFMRFSTGMEQRPPRWQECTTTISSQLQVAIGALYIRNFFDAQSKTIVADMVSNIKSVLEENLNELNWMDDITKERALQKSKNMQEHIAYPDELLDDTKIESHYQELNVDEENYLESMLNVNAMIARLYLNMDKPLSLNSWEFFKVTNVDAFYHFGSNTFKILAGLLQGVFFSTSKPLGLNYGSIGMPIGHEMMHGFDDRGSQFDKNGNLVDWWRPETKETFAAKAKCIVNQYANFTIPELELQLNGINTQGENIADNAGVKLAYLAYKKWAANHEQGIQQVPYTPAQLFWISYGTSWCSNDRAEALKTQVLIDSHSPPRYRVNVPLMNSEYFAKDFNCPIGSAMNPKSKCTVW